MLQSGESTPPPPTRTESNGYESFVDLFDIIDQRGVLKSLLFYHHHVWCNFQILTHRVISTSIYTKSIHIMVMKNQICTFLLVVCIVFVSVLGLLSYDESGEDQHHNDQSHQVQVIMVGFLFGLLLLLDSWLSNGPVLQFGIERTQPYHHLLLFFIIIFIFCFFIITLFVCFVIQKYQSTPSHFNVIQQRLGIMDNHGCSTIDFKRIMWRKVVFNDSFS